MAMNNNTWSAITVGALLLSIAVGIVVYLSTGQILDVIWGILIVFGLFLGVTSIFRGGKNNNNFGGSTGDATLVMGILIAGVGVAGLVQSCMKNIMLTVAIFIVILAVTGIVMAIKNRNS